LYLVEHFYSIQGEGKYIGSPSVFFRFGGCNMRCEGFGCTQNVDEKVILGCDTIYAVNREHFSKDWLNITQTAQLIEILQSYTLPKPVDIVLTGGEPLLYANNEILVSFLEKLHKKGHRICFETNGSLDVDFEKFPIYKECIFALSIKLSNSKEPYKKRVFKGAILNICKNSKDSFFKFSISDKSLDDEIKEIIGYSPKTDVYCMPVGDNRLDIEKNSLALVEYCKEKGYNFSDRLHIRIWNQERGI
jgi:organic radical activating enzyme